jgi:molybdate transport system substrate-binding protein
MKLKFFVAIVLNFFMFNAASAAEIRVLSAVVLADAMKELGPQFEQSTGHKLTIQFGPPVAIKGRVEAGEAFDLAIITAAFIDDVAKEGKVDASTRADIVRDVLGVAVRSGAPKPDVATVEAFKHAALDAKLIVLNAGGAAGPSYFNGVFQRLGIAQEVAAKIKSEPSPQDALKVVANGDGAISFVLTSVIRSVKGVEMAGTLPPELQTYVTFTGAVASNTKEADGARALLQFLTSDAAVTMIKAKGLDVAAR